MTDVILELKRNFLCYKYRFSFSCHVVTTEVKKFNQNNNGSISNLIVFGKSKRQLKLNSNYPFKLTLIKNTFKLMQFVQFSVFYWLTL
jgi:hypothetical protein